MESRITKAAGAVAALAGMLALRACLYHATAPTDAELTVALRDVVIRERLAAARSGPLEGQAALAAQLPELKAARVEVVGLHRPWFAVFTRHANAFYVHARVSWDTEQVEGCFPVEVSSAAPAVCYSSVAMDFCR